MSVWAYECRARDDSATRWFVSRLAINELPPGTRSVLVRVGGDWVPAIVDRSRQIAVEGMLLHEVIANEEFSASDSEVFSDTEPGKAAAANLERQPLVSDRIEPPAGPGLPTTSLKVTAAAISIPASRRKAASSSCLSLAPITSGRAPRPRWKRATTR